MILESKIRLLFDDNQEINQTITNIESIFYPSKKQLYKTLIDNIIKRNDYELALTLATHYNCNHRIEEMLNKITNINSIYDFHHSILYWPVFHENYKLTQLLLDYGTIVTDEIYRMAIINKLTTKRIIKLLRLYHKLQQ
jgi:hypothetical protein